MAFGGLWDQLSGGKDAGKAAKAIDKYTAAATAATAPYASVGETARGEIDEFLADPMGNEEFASLSKYQLKLAKQKLLAKGKFQTRGYGEAAASIFTNVHSAIVGQLSQPLNVATGAAGAQSGAYMSAANQIMGVGAQAAQQSNNVLTAGLGAAAMVGAQEGSYYNRGYQNEYSGITNARADLYGASYTGPS